MSHKILSLCDLFERSFFPLDLKKFRNLNPNWSAKKPNRISPEFMKTAANCLFQEKSLKNSVAIRLNLSKQKKYVNKNRGKNEQNLDFINSTIRQLHINWSNHERQKMCFGWWDAMHLNSSHSIQSFFSCSLHTIEKWIYFAVNLWYKQTHSHHTHLCTVRCASLRFVSLTATILGRHFESKRILWTMRIPYQFLKRLTSFAHEEGHLLRNNANLFQIHHFSYPNGEKVSKSLYGEKFQCRNQLT